MHWLQQALFALILVAAILFFSKKIRDIRRNILLGRDENYSDHPGERWRNLFLLAFGQKKMWGS